VKQIGITQMIKSKKVKLAIFFFLFFPFRLSFSMNSDIDKFSENAFFTFITKNYEEIFSMFYMPSDYNKTDRENDREAIVNGLKYIMGQLGEIKSFYRVTKINEMFYKFAIYPGPFEEIQNKKGFLNVFKVEFTKFGSGYIGFESLEINSKLYLKKVIFLLPQQNSESIGIIQRVVKYMLDMSDKQSKREKKGEE